MLVDDIKYKEKKSRLGEIFEEKLKIVDRKFNISEVDISSNEKLNKKSNYAFELKRDNETFSLALVDKDYSVSIGIGVSILTVEKINLFKILINVFEESVDIYLKEIDNSEKVFKAIVDILGDILRESVENDE